MAKDKPSVHHSWKCSPFLFIWGLPRCGGARRCPELQLDLPTRGHLDRGGTVHGCSRTCPRGATSVVVAQVKHQSDAYQYMDWPLTVPQILTEILSVTKLGDAEFNRKSLPLGVGSALTTASGYYGELVANVDITPRWICQFVSRIIFCYILYELLAGVVTATSQETDSVIESKIQITQVMTIIRWCTYSVAYLFPFLWNQCCSI